MTNLCYSAVCSAALSKEKGSALGFRSFLCWSSTLSIPMTVCTENSPRYQSWAQNSPWKGGKATVQTRCRASSRVIRVVNHLALDNLPIWPGQATGCKPNFHEYQLRLFSKPWYLDDQRAPQLRARYHLLNAHHKLKQLRCKSLLAYTCKGSLKLSSEALGLTHSPPFSSGMSWQCKLGLLRIKATGWQLVFFSQQKQTTRKTSLLE